MKVNFYPSLLEAEYLEYVYEIISGNIMIIGCKNASARFEKWIYTHYKTLWIKGRFISLEETSEYFYFYREDISNPDLIPQVHSLVMTHVKNTAISQQSLSHS